MYNIYCNPISLISVMLTDSGRYNLVLFLIAIISVHMISVSGFIVSSLYPTHEFDGVDGFGPAIPFFLFIFYFSFLNI